MAAHLAYGIAEGSNLLWEGCNPGNYSDLIQEAAALWESLSQNHPFIDGNKRVAVTSMAAFLRINGYRLTFDDGKAIAFLIGLYEGGNLRFQELEVWLRQHASLTKD